MPDELVGVEVEIRPVGSAQDHHRDHRHLHVAVVARPAGGAMLASLVFPELVAADYELYVKPDGEVRLTATVTGGEVAHATWLA